LLRYPESEFAAEANQMMNELNIKLDRKAFDNAKLYHKVGYFKSAVVALTNFQRDHPASPYNEEAAYLKFDSQFNYATESISGKQEERFFEAVDYYQNFVDQYPESKYLRTAENLYSKAISELERIKKEKSNQENS